MIFSCLYCGVEFWCDQNSKSHLCCSYPLPSRDGYKAEAIRFQRRMIAEIHRDPKKSDSEVKPYRCSMTGAPMSAWDLFNAHAVCLTVCEETDRWLIIAVFTVFFAQHQVTS